MDGLRDARVVTLIYMYSVLWFLATEAFKVALYVLWEKIQFREDAHVRQFFTITGYGKKKAWVGDLKATDTAKDSALEEGVELE